MLLIDDVADDLHQDQLLRPVGIKEFHLIEVPKNRLGVRPAVLQDVPSRLAYLSSVASRGPSLHTDLPNWAFGWRYRENHPLGDNRTEWLGYLKHLGDPKQDEWGLQTDITSFFASMDVDRLSAIVYQRYAKTASAQLIMDVIESHDRLTTRSGLPQRSYASSALAHLYVRPLDDVIEEAIRRGEVRTAARWMDDINVLGGEAALYRLHIRLQDRARQIGLELNPSKSYLLPANDLASNINLDSLQRVTLPVKINDTYDEVPFEFDLSVLLGLEAGILSGELNHPSIIRAVLRSLRDHQSFDRYRDWLEIAYRFPHLSDRLGRYVRAAALASDAQDSGASAWLELSEWLTSFRQDGWAALDYVDAQLSLIFPTAHLDELQRSTFRTWLADSTNVQKVAIAAQRLAVVDPGSCRDLIRSRVDHVTDSLLLRVLAMGLLSAEDDPGVARGILARDGRNAVLAQLLEERNWAPLPSAPDFETGSGITSEGRR